MEEQLLTKIIEFRKKSNELNEVATVHYKNRDFQKEDEVQKEIDKIHAEIDKLRLELFEEIQDKIERDKETPENEYCILAVDGKPLWFGKDQLLREVSEQKVNQDSFVYVKMDGNNGKKVSQMKLYLSKYTANELKEGLERVLK